MAAPAQLPRLAPFLLAVLLVQGCATAGASREYDPLEAVNRRVFWFNERADRYVLAPAARGWDFLVPEPAQRAVARFFLHLAFPVNLVNNLLQGKLAAAGEETLRFTVNTTAGLAGFFDPASGWGLEAHPEDFGQTLGAWGVGPGPYLVLPLLGPSDLRDGLSLLPDYASLITPFYVDGDLLTAAYTLDVVNFRALSAEELEAAKAASLDDYVLLRNAYLQRRASLVRDGDLASEPAEGAADTYDDDLYDDDLYDDAP